MVLQRFSHISCEAAAGAAAAYGAAAGAVDARLDGAPPPTAFACSAMSGALASPLASLIFPPDPPPSTSTMCCATSAPPQHGASALDHRRAIAPPSLALAGVSSLEYGAATAGATTASADYYYCF